MKDTITQLRVLTYGTYDLLHHGHINLINRAKANGEYLIVSLSTDKFNDLKGKKSYQDYDTRKSALEAQTKVDLVIPEDDWNQKLADVKKYNVDMIVMGDDWSGDPRFELLKKEVKVTFFPRTPDISTTQIKEELKRDSTQFETEEGVI
jgi:glycerol-3-phosphate cytidylyltransferase